MTPAGSNFKMTPFRLYYLSKQRKFHSHSESIIKNISKMKYDSFFAQIFLRYHRIGFIDNRSGFDRIIFSRCFRTELKQADMMKEMKTGQLKTQKYQGTGFFISKNIVC